MTRLMNNLESIKDLINLKKKSNMSTENLIIGALAGLVAGVAIGLLLAPASGSETRQKLADGAGDLTDNLKTRFKKLTNREMATSDSDPWASQNAARNSAGTPNWNG
ncbi:MAG: hypothetical protein JWN76_1646 [Chitinophagaceae bacterium]|nr:hypothetical protein [Chitinophagaceae bacterium]